MHHQFQTVLVASQTKGWQPFPAIIKWIPIILYLPTKNLSYIAGYRDVTVSKASDYFFHFVLFFLSYLQKKKRLVLKIKGKSKQIFISSVEIKMGYICQNKVKGESKPKKNTLSKWNQFKDDKLKFCNIYIYFDDYCGICAFERERVIEITYRFLLWKYWGLNTSFGSL